jgi:hypothetical protein
MEFESEESLARIVWLGLCDRLLHKANRTIIIEIGVG